MTDAAVTINAILEAGNLTDLLSDDDLRKIGRDAVDGYKADKESMRDWLDANEKAIDLAKMVREEKQYPFKNASNVVFPLITNAALQFNARAYPAICPGDQFVKCRTYGQDRDGRKAARAERVASYMSWQLSVEIEEWEAETDKLLIQLPIVNDCFRKVWFDGERARCRMIDPGKFIVNNKAQTIAQAPRLTEELTLYRYEVTEREASGWFSAREYDKGDDDEQNKTPLDYIEQHTRLDLDGDGYSEPYVITVHVETATVVRMIADFEAEDVAFVTERVTGFDEMGMPVAQEIPVGVERIKRRSYFVHYRFLPPLGGGLLGLGFGALLMDLAKGVNTNINMMIDAGHYQSLGGGFIGGEFRLAGGTRFQPGEYKTVPTVGADIRSAIVDRTFPGPSPVLFQLMGTMIDAGREIASITDVLSGETSRNMTATTTMALIEQGLKLFTASYKRVFLALSQEYRILAAINVKAVSAEKYSAFIDDMDEAGQIVMHDPAADFSAADMDIAPVSDPSSTTRMQEMAKAQLLMELAQAGMVNPQEAAERMMEAAGISERETLMPQPDPMVQQMQQEAMMLQRAAAQADLAAKQADIELTIAKVEQARAAAVADMAGAQKDMTEAALADDRLRVDAVDRLLRQLREARNAAEKAQAGRIEGMAGAANN